MRQSLASLAVLSGSVAAWSGAWGLLDASGAGGGLLGPLLLLLAGAALSVLSGTLFLNAGVPVREELSWLLKEVAGGRAAAQYCQSTRAALVAVVRSSVGFAGVLAIWYALYSVADSFLTRLEWHFAALWLAVGLALLVLAAAPSLSWDGFVAGSVAAATPEEDDNVEDEEDASLLGGRGRRLRRVARGLEMRTVDLDKLSRAERAGWYARAIIVYAGSAVAWVGAEALFEEHMPLRSLLRELVYAAAGLALMATTRTLASTAMLDLQEARAADDADDDDGSLGVPEARFRYPAARTSVASFGLFLYWIGLQTALTRYLLPSSVLRDLAYLAAGLAVLVLSGSFGSQAGSLTPASGATNLELHLFKREAGRRAQ